MILTVGFDPVLERKYYMKKLYPKVETKSERVLYNLGSKGILSTKILNNLKVDVFATGFLGGLNGEYIHNELRDLEIYNDFVAIKDETRSSIVLIEDGEYISRITEAGPRITREELGIFYELYGNLINKYNIICGLGSIPTGVPDEIFYDLIDLGNRSNKRFILDSTGFPLKYGIEAAPFMVMVTKDGLEDLTNLKLDFETEIIKAAEYILGNNVEIVVIDLFDKGTIILENNRGYRLEIPSMNLEELGEDLGYLVAGYTFGMDKQYDFETTMKLAQAFRIVYSLSDDFNKIDMSDIKKVMTKVELRTINY